MTTWILIVVLFGGNATKSSIVATFEDRAACERVLNVMQEEWKYNFGRDSWRIRSGEGGCFPSRTEKK